MIDDVRIYIPVRDRNKIFTPEEKVMVLNTFRIGATSYEKKIIDEVINDEEEGNERTEMDNRT